MMFKNEKPTSEWSNQLEAGERDDELLALAARLERAGREEPSAPSVEFRRQLRRDLLDQYEAAAGRTDERLWRLAGSVAAIGLLAVLVVATWLSISSAGRNSSGAPAIEGAATPMYIPTAPVEAAALGAYGVSAPDGLAPGRELEVTAFWHIPGALNGTAAFAQLRNDAGQIVAEASVTLMDVGSENYKADLLMQLPDSLPNGGYRVVFGLLDETGARLPLYDLVTSSVIFEYAADPLTVWAIGPADGAPSEAGPVATASPPDGGRYSFLGYSINGGIVTETTQTDGGEAQTQNLLVPGMDVEVITLWSLPADAGDATAFVHLVREGSPIVAQSDAPIRAATAADGEPAEAVLTLILPADLAPGNYQLVGGLYETATGARLPFSTAEGEVTLIEIGEYVVSDGGNANLEEMNETIERLQDESENVTPTFNINEAQDDMLVVREVSPPSGSVISGNEPVDFVVTVDYALISLPQAILEVRVVDLQGDGGRGVGLATVDNILQGTGTVTAVVVVDLGKELAGSTELGLWLQLKPDATAAPVFMIPETYHRWTYTR
jgi:hypothetical protein